MMVHQIKLSKVNDKEKIRTLKKFKRGLIRGAFHLMSPQFDDSNPKWVIMRDNP